MTDSQLQPISEHTPTPWDWSDERHVPRLTLEIFQKNDGFPVADVRATVRVTGEANAAFIVDAVNNHDRLTHLNEAYQGQVEAGAARIAELTRLLGAAASLLGDARSGAIAGSSFDEDWDERKKDFFVDWRATRAVARTAGDSQ